MEIKDQLVILAKDFGIVVHELEMLNEFVSYPEIKLLNDFLLYLDSLVEKVPTTEKEFKKFKKNILKLRSKNILIHQYKLLKKNLRNLTDKKVVGAFIDHIGKFPIEFRFICKNQSFIYDGLNCKTTFPDFNTNKNQHLESDINKETFFIIPYTDLFKQPIIKLIYKDFIVFECKPFFVLKLSNHVWYNTLNKTFILDEKYFNLGDKLTISYDKLALILLNNFTHKTFWIKDKPILVTKNFKIVVQDEYKTFKNVVSANFVNGLKSNLAWQLRGKEKVVKFLGRYTLRYFYMEHITPQLLESDLHKLDKKFIDSKIA